MIDKAKEATSTYKEQSSSLESSKQSITELREALNSGNLSYSEATEKRQELMSIQSELVDSYGKEVAGIDLVNGSLETQIDLLDKVDEKNRQAWENSVNEYTTGQKIINEFSNLMKYMSPTSIVGDVKDLANGETYWDLVKKRFDPSSGVLDNFNSNLDKIIDKVENFDGKFTATGNDYIDNYIESFDNISKSGKTFEISGDVESVKSTIEQIQTELKNVNGYEGELDKKLESIYTKADKISTDNLETYKTAIQNDILETDNLKEYYESLSEAYISYQDARNSGDDTAQKESYKEYSEIMGNLLGDSTVADKYKKYFEDMYPDLSDVVSDWEFETVIKPKIEVLEDELGTGSVLKNMFNEYSSEDLLQQYNDNFVNATDSEKAIFNSLIAIANESGETFSDLIKQLEKSGKISSQLDKDFDNSIKKLNIIDKEILNLDDDQKKVWLNVIGNTNDANEALKRYQEQVKINALKYDISFDPSTAFDVMKQSLEEQSSIGYLTDETLANLKGTYGDLTNILTYTANGIQLNSEKMLELTEQNAKAALVNAQLKESYSVKEREDAVDVLNDQILKQIQSNKTDENGKKIGYELANARNKGVDALREYIEATDKLSDEEKETFNESINNIETLNKEINEYDALEQSIYATISALANYKKAKETANSSDNFSYIQSEISSNETAFQNGWTQTDEFKEWMDYIGEFNEKVAYSDEEIQQYMSRAKRYFTEDISGLFNFLDDANEKSDGIITKLSDGTYDINVNDITALAQKMDMSVSAVTDIMLAMKDANGFDIDFSNISDSLISDMDALKKMSSSSEEARSKLEDYYDTIQKLKESGFDTTALEQQYEATLSEVKPTVHMEIASMSEDELSAAAEDCIQNVNKHLGDLEVNLESTDIEDLQNQIDAISNYSSTLSIDSADYKDALIVTTELIRKKQELENSDIAVLQLDANDYSENVQLAIAAIQQYNDAVDSLEEAKITGDSSAIDEAQTKVNSLKSSMEGMSELATIAPNIKLDPTKFKQSIASIDVSGLVKEEDRSIKIDGDISRFKTAADNAVDYINKQNPKIAIGVDTARTQANIRSALSGGTYSINIVGNVKNIPHGNGAYLLGTANSDGTAYANGNWTVGKGADDNTLVGELGTEILVRNGKWQTIGDNGAEFITTQPNDIIFNHKQSEEILKNGHINSRGKAFASGTAFATAPTQKVTGKAKNRNIRNIITGNNSSAKSSSNSSSSSSSSQKDESKDLIDWIDRRIDVLTQKAEKWSSIIESATDAGKIHNYFSQLSNTYAKLIKTYSDGAERYLSKANSIALSQDLKDKVVSKDSALFGADGNLRPYQELIVEYGEETAKSINDFQDYYDKYSDCIQNYIESTKDLANAPLEEAATKIDVLSDSIDALETKIDAYKVTEYSKANSDITKEMSKQAQVLNAYTESYNESLANLRESASALGISNYTQEVDVSKYTEGSAEYKNAILYNSMLKAYTDANNEFIKGQAEYTSTMAELYKQQFDNIQTFYNDEIELLENAENQIQKQADVLEAKGMTISSAYYSAQKQYEANQETMLNNELAQLQKQAEVMEKAGYKNTEEWYETQTAINEVTESILATQESVAKLNNEITNLANNFMEKFDNVGSNLSSTFDWVVGLMDLIDEFDEKTGAFTNEGLSAMGSYVGGYNTSKTISDQYRSLVTSMENAYESGKLQFTDANGLERDYNSLEEFKNAIDDMYSDWRDQISTTYDYESKIVEMMRKKYEAELRTLKNLIDAKGDQLQAEKDLHDYQQSIQESTTNIGSMQKQIAALQGDNSEETIVRIQQLQNELTQYQEELKEKEYDRYISDQQEMMDKLYTEYSDMIAALEQNIGLLLEQGISLAQGTQDIIRDTVTEYAEKYDYNTKLTGISDSLSRLATTDNINSLNTGINTISGKFDGIIGDGEDSIKSLIKKMLTDGIIMLEPKKVEAKVTPTSTTQPITAPSNPTPTKNTNTSTPSKNSNKASSPQGNGKPNVGDAVTFTNGRYTADSYGGGRSGNQCLGGKVYITKINPSGSRPYHISRTSIFGQHNLGWVTLSQLAGYSKGGIVKGKLPKGIHISDLPGNDDTIISAKNGEGILTPVQTKIFANDFIPAMDNFIQASSLINTNLPKINNNINRIPMNNINANYNFNLEKCVTAEDMIMQVKNSKPLQKTLQDATVNQATGKSGRII